MNLRHLFLLIAFATCQSNAQTLETAKKHIQELCSPKFYGRGYVNNGVNIAATYLENQFTTLKLKPFGDSYTQSYAFPVNTHPYEINCKIDGERKKVGVDFLMNADCGELHGSYTLLHFNMNDSLEKLLLFKKIERWSKYHLLHHDSKTLFQ